MRPNPLPKKDLELLVTLWPSFPHFEIFSTDPRYAGIRLNSAGASPDDLKREFAILGNRARGNAVPLYYDVKGRQLRITEVLTGPPDNLELRLNHPVAQRVKPTIVLFKGGEDSALLDRIEEGGHRLIFHGGPKFSVRPGESVCIRAPAFPMLGPRIEERVFTSAEREKIALAREAGFSRYFLSYVETTREVDELLEMTGRDVELLLKIESVRGMEFVVREFKKRDNLSLIAARGDLYLELDRPHQILEALRTIIEKDPEACAASRLMLSTLGNSNLTVNNLRRRAERDPAGVVKSEEVLAFIEEGESDPVPSCADFSELAWLYDIGYRRMMLCDEICMKKKFLGRATCAFESFRSSYASH